jgi:hypothetical protein
VHGFQRDSGSRFGKASAHQRSARRARASQGSRRKAHAQVRGLGVEAHPRARLRWTQIAIAMLGERRPRQRLGGGPGEWLSGGVWGFGAFGGFSGAHSGANNSRRKGSRGMKTIPAIPGIPMARSSDGSSAIALAGARVAWGRCKAFARSTGERCRAEGAGINGLCPLHYGLALARGRWKDPQPTWELFLVPSGCWVTPNRPPRGWRRSVWPQRVRHWIGLRLVASGQVTAASLYRNRGAAFLEQVRRCGVRVLPECADALLRRVRFEVDNPESSKRLARRCGARRTDD